MLYTLSTRQRNVARADTTRSRPAIVRNREAPVEVPVPPRSDTLTALTSRVRITTIVPYREEIELANFGDAAEDLSNWRLVSPRLGGEDAYSFPTGTVLLPGEELVVVVADGVDEQGVLHWRTPADVHVLDLSGDSVSLFDDAGLEVSRFQYLRR